MHGPARALVLAGVLIAASVSARAAHAYVRGLSQAQKPLKWSSSCETVTIYLNGFSAMTPDEVAKSIAGAAAAWSPAAVTCPAAAGDGGSGHPYFEIITQIATGGSAAVANDGKNSIIFDTTTFDGVSDGLAYTSVFKEPSGHIVEADIAINAAPGIDFTWANLDPSAPGGQHGIPQFDLQTVMTHEFGHFLGLAHTCVTDQTGTGADDSDAPMSDLDDKGQPIPSCDDTLVPQYATVMWAKIESDITKRVLSSDDARGLCAIYPAAQDPHACTQNTPDDGCGCATAGAPTGRLATIALVALALATRRRRRTQS